MANEIKTKIRENFSYEIPIAEVQKAGISTIGSKIDNELEPLAIEYSNYRKANNLWNAEKRNITYSIKDKKLYRTDNSNEVIFYK